MVGGQESLVCAKGLLKVHPVLGGIIEWLLQRSYKNDDLLIKQLTFWYSLTFPISLEIGTYLL